MFLNSKHQMQLAVENVFSVAFSLPYIYHN